MANELSGSNWSGTPISNSAASPNGWPEAMAPSGVNDSDREFAAAVKRHWDRINAVLTTGGSAGAYTLTPTVALAAYVHGEIFSFKANFASVGGDTLNISALGAKPLYKPGTAGPTTIAATDIQANQDVMAAYDSALNGATGGFHVLAGLVPLTITANLTRSTKTSNYTAVGGDKGNLIEATSGTFTLAFTAAATLGNGWWCYFKNSGTGDVTLDPNASETIDGVTSFKAYSNEARLIYTDGSNFFSTVLNPLAIDVLSTKTLTIPPGYSHFRGLLWGGGGGGMSGVTAAAGAGGGAGAVPFDFTAAQFGTAGTTITATIAAGGAVATVGGSSTLGALITAYGGAGAHATNGNGGGGGGAIGAGSSGVGGGPLGAAATTDNSGFGGAGGGTTSPTAGGSSAYGGGGGGSASTTAGVSGGASVFGGGGGGGAGSSTAASGGASIHGGTGGAGAVSGTATAGSQPGGGGGGARNGTGGIGGAGQGRIIGVI